MVHKYGRNDAVPNGSWAHVSLLPFAIASFRQTPIAVRIKAGGNVQDTAAGNNAQEVTVMGIDSNLEETSEAIATNGALASAATSKTWWRIHRAGVTAVGTYTAANAAAVIIEDSGSAANFLTIAAGEGQTQYAGWTVPEGKTAYLLSVHVSIDSNKTANVRCMVRQNFNVVAPPMKSKRLKLHWDGLEGSFAYKPYGAELVIPEKTDIWFEAYGDGAVSQVSVDFELLVVDN